MFIVNRTFSIKKVKANGTLKKEKPLLPVSTYRADPLSTARKIPKFTNTRNDESQTDS